MSFEAVKLRIDVAKEQSEEQKIYEQYLTDLQSYSDDASLWSSIGTLGGYVVGGMFGNPALGGYIGGNLGAAGGYMALADSAPEAVELGGKFNTQGEKEAERVMRESEPHVTDVFNKILQNTIQLMATNPDAFKEGFKTPDWMKPKDLSTMDVADVKKISDAGIDKIDSLDLVSTDSDLPTYAPDIADPGTMYGESYDRDIVNRFLFERPEYVEGVNPMTGEMEMWKWNPDKKGYFGTTELTKGFELPRDPNISDFHKFSGGAKELTGSKLTADHYFKQEFGYGPASAQTADWLERNTAYLKSLGEGYEQYMTSDFWNY